MPTYKYKCQSCEHTFEEFQGITQDPLVVCPKCGKDSLDRILGTGGGVIFKGSGFYQTDYKKETPKESKTKPQGPTTEKKEGGKESPPEGSKSEKKD